MPVKPLPAHPNLTHLKYQAKDLLADHVQERASAAQRIREFHPRFAHASDEAIFGTRFRLSDAQLTIARERGFHSWTELTRRVEEPKLSDRLDLPYHERIEDPLFRRAVDLLDAGDAAGLQALLKEHPKLVQQRVEFTGGNYFRTPSLLEFVAENPVRRGRLPARIVEVTRVILEAGADAAMRNEALKLVATGRVPRECGVQRALIELLCGHGAEPEEAIRGAALHREEDAVKALLEQGAKLDLPVAVTLGRMDAFTRLLPEASPEERHMAMALAAQYGRVEMVRALLDAGEDPDRYDPPGAHSHATPLHQAALAGHMAVVRLLVERGARRDQKDLMWGATPVEWARHEGQAEVEAYLRELDDSGERGEEM